MQKILIILKNVLNKSCVGLNFLQRTPLMYRVRIATMTHFYTFGTVTPVLITGFG